MHRGDTLRLNFDFVDDEGNPLEENQFDEILTISEFTA